MITPTFDKEQTKHIKKIVQGEFKRRKEPTRRAQEKRWALIYKYFEMSEEHERMLKRNDKNIEEHRQTLDRLAIEIVGNKYDLNALQEKLAKLPTRDEMNSKFDAVMYRLFGIETELAANSSRLTRCEEKLGIV